MIKNIIIRSSIVGAVLTGLAWERHITMGMIIEEVQRISPISLGIIAIIILISIYLFDRLVTELIMKVLNQSIFNKGISSDEEGTS